MNETEKDPEPDLCSACDHDWHGLTCGQRDPVRAVGGVSWSIPCPCDGEA